MIENRIYTLYKQDSNGKIRTWSIYNYGYDITRESGLIDGDKVYAEDFIDEGKAGRTVQEQIDLFMMSRLNKQIDKGYVYDLEEAKNNKPTNALGLKRPMLAQRIDRVNLDKINFEGAIVQRKYDGHRCIITKIDGKIFAYSKNGKPLTAITEITESLEHVVCERMFFDGELYSHGNSLQRISSWAKKRQPETCILQFICYDIITEGGYSDRCELIKKFLVKIDSNIVIAPSIPCDDFSLENLYRIRDEQIALGYEGLIVRLDGLGYDDGKRSKQLLKVKSVMSDEFLVKNVISSKDGWGILVCIARNGKTFTSSAPGTHRQKEECLINKEHFIGRHITLEYANLTDDGIPFHPVSKNWRETE